MGKLLSAVVFMAFLAIVSAQAATPPRPVTIVAAENFYGDVARQVGGPDVRVVSILNNPEQDPHLFEASPSVGRAVSAARIVIANGLGYDPWMEKLLRATRANDRRAIVVGDLVGRKPGDNPHVWYDPATMPALARAVAAALEAEDPSRAAEYRQRLQHFLSALQAVQTRIATLRRSVAGTPVTATEPVFGYMFAALGMQVRNLAFQRAVMNGTEPSASGVAALEHDLRSHRVQLLVYNSQATDPIAERIERIARAAHVPVLGVTETEPPGTDYQDWMTGVLDALNTALRKQP